MGKIIRIGTRESQLAVWQADRVKSLLAQHGISSELIFIKSEGDIDLNTPLYEMGVQGIFTRSLDLALLKGQIDIAVHSMKDVPTQLPKGIAQFAVLERGSFKDLLVYKGEWSFLEKELKYINAGTGAAVGKHPLTIATSSIRRKAQWLNRYPHHTIENLRGNVNTRMRKLDEENWNAAIFAAAGLERIGLRPAHSLELDWMLPAPAQGAIMVVGREDDPMAAEACRPLNDEATALCTRIERDFLRALLGGCSTPISGLAEIKGDEILFRGNILSLDGSQKADVEKSAPLSSAVGLGIVAARELLSGKGQKIAEKIQNGGK